MLQKIPYTSPPSLQSLSKSRGFTLIELMISVAILGVISSVALVMYSSYQETTRGQAMSANFELAVKKAKGNYVVARQLRTIGAPTDNAVPPNASGWVDSLNTAGSAAPGGGEAYIAGTGSSITGAVGIVYSGSYASHNSVVTIHRPAYAGIPAGSVMVAQLDI